MRVGEKKGRKGEGKTRRKEKERKGESSRAGERAEDGKGGGEGGKGAFGKRGRKEQKSRRLSCLAESSAVCFDAAYRSWQGFAARVGCEGTL